MMFRSKVTRANGEELDKILMCPGDYVEGVILKLEGVPTFQMNWLRARISDSLPINLKVQLFRYNKEELKKFRDELNGIIDVMEQNSK